MADRSRPRYAKPGWLIVEVVCLLGTQVRGFMFGSTRTTFVWSSRDHVNHVSSHEEREAAALSRLMPSPSRTCYNVIASPPAAEDLNSEEVEVSMWGLLDHLAILELTLKTR